MRIQKYTDEGTGEKKGCYFTKYIGWNSNFFFFDIEIAATNDKKNLQGKYKGENA